MRRCLFFLMMLFCVANLRAQGDVEYRMEIGGGAGLVNYTGDYNSSLVKNLQPMASAIFRRVFNPYCGLKMNLSYGKLKGSSEDEKTYYPEAHPEPYTFDNSLVDLGTVFEYNLLPYGTGVTIGVPSAWCPSSSPASGSPMSRPIKTCSPPTCLLA